jgi:hypothetical protein
MLMDELRSVWILPHAEKKWVKWKKKRGQIFEKKPAIKSLKKRGSLSGSST